MGSAAGVAGVCFLLNFFGRKNRRTLYLMHDITAQLQSGKKAIGVLLGNGWYNHQSTAVWYFHEAPWRNRPTFIYVFLHP